jgi:hypothetical protein
MGLWSLRCVSCLFVLVCLRIVCVVVVCFAAVCSSAQR